MWSAYKANSDGQCWPSERKIAMDLSLSKSTVKRAIAAIRQDGSGFVEFMENGAWVKGYSYAVDLGKTLNIGEAYNLKVTCEGDQIYFYVDGVEVAKGEIPAGFETGTVGVGSKGSCIEVDNFNVSKGGTLIFGGREYKLPVGEFWVEI